MSVGLASPFPVPPVPGFAGGHRLSQAARAGEQLQKNPPRLTGTSSALPSHFPLRDSLLGCPLPPAPQLSQAARPACTRGSPCWRRLRVPPCLAELLSWRSPPKAISFLLPNSVLEASPPPGCSELLPAQQNCRSSPRVGDCLR